MPLKKGQTNNPHGRPRKNASLTELLAKYGNKKVSMPGNIEFDGMKLKDALAKRLWQLAVYDKDLASMRYIFDRIDGKPAQTIITNIDRGDMPIFKTVQKELFSEEEMEGIQDEGTLEPPEAASPSSGE
jgi:hypothetical protein